MASTPELRKAVSKGLTVAPLEGWAKDVPSLSYRPDHSRDLFPWVAADGRRFRAMQCRIV